MNIKIFCRCS